MLYTISKGALHRLGGYQYRNVSKLAALLVRGQEKLMTD